MAEGDERSRGDSKKAERVPEHVGRQMRKWRLAAGMKQVEVADKMGVSKGHISSAESGKGNLSLPKFLDFCRAIGYPASKVLEDRLLAKHRDVDRLSAAIVEQIGLSELQWLAELGKDEWRGVLQRAHEHVESLRSRPRHSREARTGGRRT